MKRIFLFTATLFFLCQLVISQNKITVEQIYGGFFRANSMDQLQPLKKSNQYTVLNNDRSSKSMQIDLYDFNTLEKLKTLFDTKDFSEIKGVDDYRFNKNENQILIATNRKSIFRHSYLADYYLFDMEKKSLKKISTHQVQEPTFSPDGQKIAYAYLNNLYVYTIASDKTSMITNDGQKNQIINGITDWVYEEEFAFVRAFQWTANSEHLAYIKFDESQVPEFSMDVYGTELYPTQEVFKYPKAGEKNANVSLHIYHLKTNTTTAVGLNQFKAEYIARINTTNLPETVSLQLLNRHQNHLQLVHVDANGNPKIILEEKDNAYVDVTDDLTYLDNHDFIWTSERDGFNHIYHYDQNGKLKNQITKGSWEVTKYYGFDKKAQTIFYQSTEPSSIERAVYQIGLNVKNKRLLTNLKGTNNASFSPDFSSFILTHSSAAIPTNFSLVSTKTAQVVKTILENSQLKEKREKYNIPQKEFFTLKNENGEELNAYFLKPTNFDPAKKYPLLMFQYSGPGSQQVADQWLNTNDYWHAMLTQKGYIVACVDGRGTGYKGVAFKKVTQKELGKYEVEDQIFAAKTFAKYDFIDGNRIGIWGWSYGGFMSSNCILKGNDVFKMAIAVAPVTNWRFYDSIYTERFMTTPEENPTGYDDNSPINHVDKLKGKYMIIHGTADDNVHVQNAMRMIRALQLANKDFDQAIYPDTNHGIYGGKIRIQLYNKMTDYILNNL